MNLRLLYEKKETHGKKPEGEQLYVHAPIKGYFELYGSNAGGNAALDKLTITLHIQCHLLNFK